MAVDDATVDNGCLWVLPGSHRNGYLWPTGPHGRPDEFDLADESHGFDEEAAVPVEVERGSVVFFNGYLLHRSFRNRSDGYRRALVNHYCNSWSLLPWAPTKTVPGQEIPTLDNRTVTVVAGDDPYAWRGTSRTPSSVFLRRYARDPHPVPRRRDRRRRRPLPGGGLPRRRPARRRRRRRRDQGGVRRDHRRSGRGARRPAAR
jgi:hypothetical protein